MHSKLSVDHLWATSTEHLQDDVSQNCVRFQDFDWGWSTPSQWDMMGLCCKRPEILWQLLLCFQPVLRFVGARRHHGTAIYCCVDECGNFILTGEFNMFQNALALKLGFYMALPTATQNITAHIHVHTSHTFYHYRIITVGSMWAWADSHQNQARKDPGPSSSGISGRARSLEKDAMGCHGMPHGTGDVWKFQQRIVKSRTMPRKPTR